MGSSSPPENKAFLFCLQNLSLIKQLSTMLVEQRRRDDLRTADNTTPMSIAATFGLAEYDSRTSFCSKSSMNTVQI